jgi:predicted amidophosphoribosyltransferase
MAQFQPRQILGRWRQGFALDVHTIRSVPVGYNEFGHMQYDTTRSEVGELLFKLKNRADTSTIGEIAQTASEFMNQWHPPIRVIVPVPPSNARSIQPVALIASAISERLQIPLVDCVTKTRNTPQLKNIFDLDERLKALEGAHAVDVGATQGKTILLFDNLYRSGATMSAVTTLLYEQGQAAEVFALTVTRTRSHQ